MVGLGRRPNYHTIARYVTTIEPLPIDYFHLWLDKEAPDVLFTADERVILCYGVQRYYLAILEA